MPSLLPHPLGSYSHTRYTAATCEPDEFEAKGFTLRPKIYNRETELFIVMTMYNVSVDIVVGVYSIGTDFLLSPIHRKMKSCLHEQCMV